MSRVNPDHKEILKGSKFEDFSGNWEGEGEETLLKQALKILK